MHAWLARMGISGGGKNYRLVSEQARRISACRLTFLTEIPGAEFRQNGAFVQDAVADERQRALWQDRVIPHWRFTRRPELTSRGMAWCFIPRRRPYLARKLSGSDWDSGLGLY